MEIKFTIPEQLVNVEPQTWLLIAALVGIALVVSAIVEVIRRRYWKKHHEKLAKKATAGLLAGLSSVFTLASYFILFASENASLLAALPFVGERVPQILGIAYVFYNLAGNKFYQSVADVLNKWSRGKQVIPPAVTETTGPVPDVTPDVLR